MPYPPNCPNPLKRGYPFGDDEYHHFQPYLKNHISDKDRMKSTELQKVQAHTLKMLFQNANKLPPVTRNSKVNNFTSCVSCTRTKMNLAGDCRLCGQKTCTECLKLCGTCHAGVCAGCSVTEHYLEDVILCCACRYT